MMRLEHVRNECAHSAFMMLGRRNQEASDMMISMKRFKTTSVNTRCKIGLAFVDGKGVCKSGDVLLHNTGALQSWIELDACQRGSLERREGHSLSA